MVLVLLAPIYAAPEVSYTIFSLPGPPPLFPISSQPSTGRSRMVEAVEHVDGRVPEPDDRATARRAALDRDIDA